MEFFSLLKALLVILFSLALNRIDFYINFSESHSSSTSPSYNISIYEAKEEHPNPAIRDVKSSIPGHMGHGVLLSNIDIKTKYIRDSMFQKHAFDEFISELIPLDRELPDWRDPQCSTMYDTKDYSLPSTSIIICFYNEAWSTLLRTLYSILNRSPPHLIREILLVDDFSDMEHLKGPLEDYITKHFPPNLIRILRLKKREGLMRCRMAGISVSKASVLTFLDSHIEASSGWLEPLLSRIKEDFRVIPTPVIDAINDTTFYYTFIRRDLIGLLNWKMEFEWHEFSRDENEGSWAPYKTPVMAGGLFSISKAWFKELGYYDEGMDIWGGENLELSFKAWMCGGSIEILPCSRVGHVFRSWSPYKVNISDVKRNNIRVAKVWLDDFQYLYYHRFGAYDLTGEERLQDYGNVSERIALRSSLKCQSFKWYLDTVAQSLPYHALLGAGELRNPHSGLCIDQEDQIQFMDQSLGIDYCSNKGGSQYWWMTEHNYLLRDYMCIGVIEETYEETNETSHRVVITHCGRAAPWIYDPISKQMKYSMTNTCLSVDVSQNVYIVALKTCESSQWEQQWEFTIYKETPLKYSELF